MNSRVEAAFEDQVKAALEASRREMAEDDVPSEQVPLPEEVVDDIEDVEFHATRKGKRKRDEEELNGGLDFYYIADTRS
jgi:hypothetical protein